MQEHAWRLEPLTANELAQIEDTACRLLEEVGVVVEHDRAREMLYSRGCAVRGDRVALPRQTVEWALQNLRPHNVVHSADGERELSLQPGLSRVHNSGGEPNVWDIHTGERRPATLQDQASMTRLLDALPNVDITIPLFTPQDVPPPLMNIAGFEMALRHSRGWFGSPGVENPMEVRYVLELAAARCGDLEKFRARPTIGIAVCPVSPLRLPENVAGALLAVAEAGVPLDAVPCPTMGATAPITLAGALAQQHAENLAVFVLAAAAQPGLPVTYCSRANPINLRTAVSDWGGPEVGMAGACAAQLARRLGLPCDVYGITSGASADEPRGHGGFANALLPMLAGAEVLSGVAGADQGLTASYELAVLDDEMIGLMRRILRGPEVREATLGFEVMREVILGEGVFLGEPHTVEHMRAGALWLPEITTRAQAREKALDLLAGPAPEPLPEAIARSLDEIMAEARRELAEE